MGKSLAAASRMFGKLLTPQPKAEPVTAENVATVGSSKTTHAIAGGEWRYDRPNRTACGRTATGVNWRQSGTPIEITCRTCVRLTREGR